MGTTDEEIGLLSPSLGLNLFANQINTVHPMDVTEHSKINNFIFYKKTPGKKRLTTFLIVITLGIYWLFMRWIVRLRIKSRFVVCALKEATRVFVQCEDRSEEVVKLSLIHI
eukprot:TRINITY_DN11990_c0_g2_i4.p1 TRINITY_DN11990_c0_g2~~TRINITY_DN11990_c0_g2_i4.p1  ORF type:complete len:112 (+),score=10.31 TRINITY_DN11990_c0_g2_i4:122-457(+)